MNEQTPETKLSADGDDRLPRRNFVKRAVAVVVGGFISLFPLAAGLVSFADPLRKRSRKMPGEGQPKPEGVPEGYISVATVDALPADGMPQFFRVIADRMDGWTYFPSEPVGAVFLRKEKDGSVIAYNSTCPHAGCAVDFRAGERNFYCPCHASSFTLEGTRSDDSPSPRDLDTLETKVIDGTVWVKYENYRTGMAERTVIS
jgi:menaquinol-cytochrome c reductase iron-sulfur subunit